MISSIFTVMFLCLSGCGSMPSREALSGAATSLSIVGVASQVKEAFTPEYPLYVSPVEVCSVMDNSVNCTIYPCDKDCNVSTPVEIWVVDNPFVSTIRSSNFSAIVAYCSANKKACVELIGKYEGTKIVIQKED